MDRYRVLVPRVKNDKSGKVFPAGETVTEKDFPKYVLKHWADKQPPVLARMEENGRNA